MNSRKSKDTHTEAIRELTQLSERLESDVDLIEAMSLHEAQAELRALKVDPNRSIVPGKIERPPERKGMRLVFFVGGSARLAFQNSLIELTDGIRESNQEVRHVDMFRATDCNRVATREKTGPECYFPEKTTAELLSEVINQRIIDSQRQIELHRELFSLSELKLERTFSELKSFSPEGLENERWFETSTRGSKVYGALASAVTIAAVLIGILNAPIPKFLFSLLSTVATLFLVSLTGHLFRASNNATLGTGLAKLKRAMTGTSALIVGSLIGIGVMRWTGVSTSHLLSGFLIATEFLLILLAGQCSASYALINWPAKVKKRLQKIEREHEERKHRIMAEESELKSLFDARARLLNDQRPTVDPAFFTIMN
ncbi:MAG: hypothetical protein AABN95_12845 [Acidobacteriota bacterium]